LTWKTHIRFARLVEQEGSQILRTFTHLTLRFSVSVLTVFLPSFRPSALSSVPQTLKEEKGITLKQLISYDNSNATIKALKGGGGKWDKLYRPKKARSQLVFSRESYFVIPGKAGIKMQFPGNSRQLIFT
jgi:hypothetical protein